MATVTGLTAERMLEIEAASVVDGDVVGDNLVLIKHDGSTIDAGSVRGAVGAAGAIGPVGYDTSPIGSVITHTSQVIPPEYLVANGQVVSENNYPHLTTFAAAEVAAGNPLWAVAGVAPNRNVTIPDLRDRFIFSKGAKAFGSKSGEETHSLTGAESGVNGNGVTNGVVDHVHNIHGTRAGEPADPGNSHVVEAETTLVAYGADTDPAGAHYHNLIARAADAAHNNMPPYCVLAFLIKAKGVVVDAGVLIGGGVGLQGRTNGQYVTANIANNAVESGRIPMFAGYRVFRIVTSVAARVRLYSDSTKRDADVARPITVDPPDYPTVDSNPSHGVMFETLTGVGFLDFQIAPNVIGAELTTNNNIPINVTNLSGGASVVTVTIYYQRIEP